MVRSRRRVYPVALLLVVFGLGISVVAQAYGQGEGSASLIAEGYQPGPLASRSEGGIASLPDGAKELLGLSALVAFLYGFRASGLARS